MVNLPEQLEVPFAALQRWFGTTAPCGNLSANVYYNFNDHREIEYSATVGLSSVHRTTERESGLLFVHMEEKVSSSM
jgi:hypothetical protein